MIDKNDDDYLDIPEFLREQYNNRKEFDKFYIEIKSSFLRFGIDPSGKTDHAYSFIYHASKETDIEVMMTDKVFYIKLVCYRFNPPFEQQVNMRKELAKEFATMIYQVLAVTE